jgi:hypothetical protein
MQLPFSALMDRHFKAPCSARLQVSAAGSSTELQPCVITEYQFYGRKGEDNLVSRKVYGYDHI